MKNKIQFFSRVLLLVGFVLSGLFVQVGVSSAARNNTALFVSPQNFIIGKDSELVFSVFGGPLTGGKFCVTDDYLTDVVGFGCEPKTPLDSYGRGVFKLIVNQKFLQSIKESTVVNYKAVIVDGVGAQFPETPIVSVNFQVKDQNTKDPVDCDPALDPTCQSRGGGTGSSGGLPAGDGGFIGEGLGGVSDRFDTQGRLTGSQSIGELIENIIEVILDIVLAIAILMLIIGGYLYITSAGKEDQAKQGRRTLTYAVIGIVLVMMSYTIIFVLNEFLQS